MVRVKYIGMILCLYGSIWIILPIVIYRNGQSRQRLPFTHEIPRRYARHHPDYFKSLTESKRRTPEVRSLSEPSRKAPEVSRPLLCLFTTLIQNNTCGSLIHRLLLKNWISLSPVIRPYLFLDDRVDAGCRQVIPRGWKTIPISQYRDGLPVFTDMSMTIEASVDSVFVGYANPDVLFDDSLLETLDYIRRAVRNVEVRNVLLVGRRRDYVTADDDVLKIAKAISAPSKLPLARPDQIDYVIFTRLQFKWEEIPDVVVGAPRFANILLALALDWNYIVLDVTSSLNAVRLSLAAPDPGPGGDPDSNTRLLTRKYRTPQKIVRRGQIICVTYLTICRKWTGDLRKTKKGCNFRLAKRRKLPSWCQGQNSFKRIGHRHRTTPEPDEYDTFDAEMILL